MLEYTETIAQNEVQACLGRKCDPWISSLSCKVEGMLEQTDFGTKSLTQEQIREAQREDSTIGQVLPIIQAKAKPSKFDRAGANEKVRCLFNGLKFLRKENGILYRIAGRFKQLVLPEKYHNLVLTKLHDEMGHINSAKVMNHLRKRFYWPRMQEDVEEYVNRNIVNKKPNRTLFEDSILVLQPMSDSASCSLCFY
jgi:hypothetical protein